MAVNKIAAIKFVQKLGTTWGLTFAKKVNFSSHLLLQIEEFQS